MKIGILSDTYDDIANVQEAKNIFNKNEVNLYSRDFIEIKKFLSYHIHLYLFVPVNENQNSFSNYRRESKIYG